MHVYFSRSFLTPLVVLVLVVRALVVLITAPLAACSYTAPSSDLCAQAAGAPVTELTDRGNAVLFETPGTIIAYHGFGCGKSNQSGTENFIKVDEGLDLPPYVTNATVFLNGWRSKYLSKDHHVAGLGTLVGKIRLEGTTLKWQAASVLSDDNFDDGYDSCYFYTALGWNAAAIDLTVTHDDGCFAKGGAANFFIADNDGTNTALSAFPTFMENATLAASKTIAVLPRGYGFQWLGGDHHLLQLAYNSDHSDIFIEKGKPYNRGTVTATPALPNDSSRVDSGFVSWETYGILKDNADRRDYRLGEIVSGMGGTDVGVVQPPFAILPHEDMGNFGACLDAPGTNVHTDAIVVENVPYEYAVPMLTGWELAYGCNDHHVTEIGTWIDEISYEKAPGATAGTLRYKVSSILRDKDSSPGHYSNHKESILGLRPLAPGKIPIKRTSIPGA
jgi:hypothetical protein